MPGHVGLHRFRPRIAATVSRATMIAAGLKVPHAAASVLRAWASNSPRLPAFQRQPEQLAELAGEDDHGDAAVKPTVTG
jgi:hypothetical protein